MSDVQKIEGYLINLGLTYEKVGENAWLINDFERGLVQIMIQLESPIAIVRTVLMKLPSSNKEKFFFSSTAAK